MITNATIKNMLKELELEFLVRDEVLLVPVTQQRAIHITVRENVLDLYEMADEIRHGQAGFRAVCDSIMNLNLALPAVRVLLGQGADGGNVVTSLQIPFDDNTPEPTSDQLKHWLGLVGEAANLVEEPLRIARYKGKVVSMPLAFALRRLRNFHDAGVFTEDDLKQQEFSGEDKRREVTEAFIEARDFVESEGLELLESEEDEPEEELLAVAGL